MTMIGGANYAGFCSASHNFVALQIPDYFQTHPT